MPDIQLPDFPYTVNAPVSTQTFPDGRKWRLEIPSVEGPAVLAAVLEEAARYNVPIDRISQGSGIQLLTDAEITDMVRQCQDRDIECCLFVGPRGAFDIGAAVLASNGGALKGALRGARQLSQALEDIDRAIALGVHSVLVADVGLLAILGQKRAAGAIPADFIIKVSVLSAPSNPATAAVLAQLGANSLNVPSDLSIDEVAEIRVATDAWIDFYVESPDDVGGFIRHHDIADLVRVAAPIYLKFGLRNTPALYPSGAHLEQVAIKCGIERVRRAAIGLEHLKRKAPELYSERIT
jgi:peptidase U32-like protein